MAKHALYAVEIGTGTTLGGIRSLNVVTGTNVQGEASSAEVYPRFQSLTGQQPRATFETVLLQDALDACALTGVDIGGLTNGLILYAQKHADGGTRAGATSHRKYTIADGVLVPRQLRVDHQGSARLSYEAIVKYDGSNDPIVVAESQSLPGSVVDDERYTLGAITLESVSITRVRSLAIDFGIQVQTEGADSDIWDTEGSIVTIVPTITIRGIDPEWFKAANIPLTGKAATHANTSIYLRKRAEGGTFVADLTAEHIKLTAEGVVWCETVYDAQEQAAVETALMMRCHYDGTNNPIVIDTTSALP